MIPTHIKSFLLGLSLTAPIYPMYRAQIRPALASRPRVAATIPPLIARYSARSLEHEEQILTLKKQLAALRVESLHKQTEYQFAAFAREQCERWKIYLICTAWPECHCKLNMNKALQELKDVNAAVVCYEDLLDKHEKKTRSKKRESWK